MKRITTAVLAALAALALIGAGGAQFPSQRFGKVTAGQVETTTLTLPSGAGMNKVLTSDGAGNGSWQAPSGPQDVGWHATEDGNHITSLYRKLVVGGPTVGDERLLVQGYQGWGYSTDLIEPSYWTKDGSYCFASSGMASAAFENTLNTVWMPTDDAPWVALRFIDGKHQVNRVKFYKYRDDDGQGVVRFPWDEFVVYGSDNSTNGADGDWTPISPRFTIQHVSESSHSYDFPDNTKSFAWLKLAGRRSLQPANLWLHEVEAFSYLPTPAHKFIVDAAGNPATDGTMTAGALTLTSGTKESMIRADDVQLWNGFAINNAWRTNTLYPAEVLTQRSLNLSRNFGSDHRLLVQGYQSAAWSGNLTADLGSGASSPEYRAAHLFTNLPFYQTPHSDMFDHRTDTVWLVYSAPAGSYWLAYKFDTPTQVNRVRHCKFGGWNNPWTSFTVWGSDDSVSGADGHWTQISEAFTLNSNMEAVTVCDFVQNSRAFLWVKLVGAPSASQSSVGVREIEFESYQPAPDKRFWVDSHGNPATDGTMTAAALTLTTNSLAATVGVADIQAWKNNPWAWTDDNQNITAKYKNVILGSTVAGAERFKVIGFQGSGYSANLARLAGTSYWANSNATNQSWYAPPASFNGIIAAAQGGSGDGWAPGSGNPVWLVFKFQSGVAKVVNKLTLWREGDKAIPWASYSVYGSNDTTNGVDGTWEQVAGPFLPTIGGGQYYQTLSENVVFTQNTKAFNAYKIMGPPRSGRVLEVEACTYAPTPDKSFYVDAQGNPGTDGTMTAGTLTLTSGTLTAVVQASDVQRWNNLGGGITVERDPGFAASVAGTITGQDVAHWNSVYNAPTWAATADAGMTSKYVKVGVGLPVTASVGANQLLVQGYAGAGFTTNIVPSPVTVYASSTYPGTDPPSRVFDHVLESSWRWAPEYRTDKNPWIVCKCPPGVTVKPNKIKLYRTPWASIEIYGSSDTTNGTDGTWTRIAGPLGPMTNNLNNYEFEFRNNENAYSAIKIAGPVISESDWSATYEIELYEYVPTPDKKFYVDERGNPGTDGMMTVGSIHFTPQNTAPADPQPGTAYFDNPSRKLRVWDGAAWQDAW